MFPVFINKTFLSAQTETKDAKPFSDLIVALVGKTFMHEIFMYVQTETETETETILSC